MRRERLKNITTKIKAGSKRYEFEEWCEEVLKVDVYSAWEKTHVG